MSGILWADEQLPFTGQMWTEATGVLNLGSVAYPMERVMDRGACAGSWSGQFAQDDPNLTYQVGMTIDQHGDILSCTGFAGPVQGRFFAQSGFLAGNFATGESAEGWDEIMVRGATLAEGRMSGRFALHSGPGIGGSFELGPPPGGVDPTLLISSLRPPVPNPTRGTTLVSYALAQAGRIQLGIYDLTGRLVRRLVDGERGAGTETVVWDAKGESGLRLGAGVYFVRLASSGVRDTRKVILLP